MRPLVFVLSLVAIGTLAPAALAQKQQDDNYGYRFDDDFMVGDTLGTTPPLLKVRKHPLKVQLIRPRASFVAEMLKSVEQL